jgi:hypothetical protein
MSKLNIKQIAGPATGGRAPTGSIPVFDGNLLRWSNSAATAIQLPSGTTAQRPAGANAADGMFRYNSDLGKIEALQAGSWVNAVNEIKSFLDLVDAPKTYTAGKVLAVNALGTGLEYIDPTVTIDKIKGTSLTDAGKYLAVKTDGSGVEFIQPPEVSIVRERRFRFNFAGSVLDTANPVQDLPAGWSFTVLGTTALRITHNMGKPLSSLLFMGYNPTPDAYWARSPSGNANFSYKLATQNDTFDLNGLIPGQVASQANGHVIVVATFVS